MLTTKRKPATVGEILVEEFMRPMGLTQSALAQAMGIQCKQANELCNNRRAVTAATALILARVFGNSPDFWLNVQRRSDLWEAMNSPRERERIDRAKPLAFLDKNGSSHMAPLDGRSRPTAQLEQKRDQRLGRNARRLVYRRFARQPSDFRYTGDRHILDGAVEFEGGAETAATACRSPGLVRDLPPGRRCGDHRLARGALTD